MLGVEGGELSGAENRTARRTTAVAAGSAGEGEGRSGGKWLFHATSLSTFMRVNERRGGSRKLLKQLGGRFFIIR